MSKNIFTLTAFFHPVFLILPPILSRFQLDHARSNLIWNLKTREELRDGLEGEMRAFSVDRELGSGNVISWNHQEFEVYFGYQYYIFTKTLYKVTLCLCSGLQVRYECLSDEIKIGDYYLRLLLEEDENEETNAIKRS